ncbi:leucine-rich repeat protein [Skeletonema marinoi]|uniref:Leucine-rich repeat protein n=1 Tax=Skeletonema marinoi TaxID=267567 RepID=A0AAD9D878_9STRA|nr:leucine-rich repeat protein [Skeletonema marinoi]
MENDTQSSLSAAAAAVAPPRRSGRERRQAESVYDDATAAAAAAKRKKSRKAEASEETRKRKPADDEDEEQSLFDFSVSEEGATSFGSQDPEKLVRKWPTNIGQSFQWGKKISPGQTHRERESTFDRSEFQSVDGDKVFHYNNWVHRHELTYGARSTFERAQRALVAKQQDQHSIKLKCKFSIESKLTQVPYHENMMQCYDYFAVGVKTCRELECFTISDYNLPPSPWLGSNILPVLDRNSRLETLELSNCSLSATDLSSLVKLLAGNKSISSLDISRSNIESVETVKALAKAIKKHPTLRNVNLAYCSLGNGSIVALKKMLKACKGCDSLEIGHEDFNAKCGAAVAKFIGEKNSLVSFSLLGATLDTASKKAMMDAIVKNKTIKKLCLRSNKLQLPGIIRNSKKNSNALSRLTHLDLSCNNFLLKKPECKLVTLILSNNHLTSKGADVLLPAVKKNTSLQHLDLSANWLSDAVAPAVLDLLKDNSQLLTLDLSGNKSLRTHNEVRTRSERGWGWNYNREDAGCAKIVKGALFDIASLDALVRSNHVCVVKMKGSNRGDLYERRLERFINALNVSNGKKIKLKIILARTFVQQEFGYNKFGLEVMPSEMPRCLEKRTGRYWNGLTRRYVEDQTDPRLSRLYDVIVASQSLPLLFARGPGEALEKVVQKKKNGKSNKPRKRRKFGEADDDDDEAWLPKGAKERVESGQETGEQE